MNRKNMTKALNKKFKEVLAHIEKRFPSVEIRNFDYSVLDKAVSLVEDILYHTNRICYARKYRFSYWLVLPLTGNAFLVSRINLSITKEKFTHTLYALYISSVPRIKPSEKDKGALFVTLYAGNLDCQPIELDNVLKKLAVKEKLYFHRGFETGAGYGNPFPEGYYSFEIPFDVEVLEYII
jgi:hypothetical protein